MMVQILNVLIVFIFLAIFGFIVYQAIKNAGDCDAPLPEDIEHCLIEIEDFALDSAFYNRVKDLCDKIRELNDKNDIHSVRKYLKEETRHIETIHYSLKFDESERQYVDPYDEVKQGLFDILSDSIAIDEYYDPLNMQTTYMANMDIVVRRK